MPSRKKSSEGPALPAAVRARITAARQGLLVLHKALLDYERIRFERIHGRVESSGAFLQLVLNDPHFAWLRPVSELVVQMDRVLASDEPGAEVDADMIMTQAGTLLRADEEGQGFGRQYHRALQESPDVVLAHAQWKRAAQAK